MIGLHYKSRVIAVALTLLMLATSVVALDIHIVAVVHASSVIIVPDDYASIQDAVGNASAGDTVFVRAGTYYGGLIINKPLTLEGESKVNTTLILYAVWGIVGIEVTASDVTISGFNFVSNGQSGLDMMVLIDGRSGANYDSVIGNVFNDTPPCNQAISTISTCGDRIIGNTVIGPSAACIVLDFGSDGCLVAKNNVTAGFMGIYSAGDDNVFAFNIVVNQVDSLGLQCGGITLALCSNNTVVGNTLIGNTYGVSCWRNAKDTLIYHNNFIENVHQTYSESSFLNMWDAGYPSGGNYWSDYNGTDSFSGSYQNVTGSDGIGDTPMIRGSNVVDHYPFMQPVGDIVGDVNLDGKVDIKDIAVVARCFGLTAGCVCWNPLADVNGDGKIDIADIALVARNFGKSWLAPVSVGPPITSPTDNLFVITARDSSDSYLRDWAVTFDRPMVARQDSGYVGADSHEYHFSGDTMTVQWTLSAGPHYLMFIVSQVGGSSYGTYSGTININGQTYSFSGVDGTDPVRIDFTV